MKLRPRKKAVAQRLAPADENQSGDERSRTKSRSES